METSSCYGYLIFNCYYFNEKFGIDRRMAHKSTYRLYQVRLLPIDVLNPEYIKLSYFLICEWPTHRAKTLYFCPGRRCREIMVGLLLCDEKFDIVVERRGKTFGWGVKMYCSI